MMSKRIFLAVSMLALSTIASTSAFAGASTTGKLPFAFPVDTCVETVDLSGWFRQTINFVEDAGGGTHLVIQLTAHGKGIGQTTGTRYVWNDSFIHDTEHFLAGGSFVLNAITRTILVSNGGLPNSRFFFTQHVTITPNGDIIIDRLDLTADCL